MNEDLSSTVNDGSRKIRVRGKQVIVPLKYDEEGNPATQETIRLKRLTLDDLRFLKVWREQNWNVAKAVESAGIGQEHAERLIKKLQVFREEDARTKALAEIPTAAWISAKHVENVYEGGSLQDSEHKSLSELAKISGAYKNTANINLTQNVFNLPKVSAEVEAKLKELAEHALETEATKEEAA